MEFDCDEQYPSLSASYRLDLSEPFTIVPESFDESVNKKRALLIGVNYNKHTDAKLTTSHDDVKSIKVRIIYFAFLITLVLTQSFTQEFLCNCYNFSNEEEFMTVLLDDDVHTAPTKANILASFQALAKACNPGDVVVIQFSGHGCRILDLPVNSDIEGYDEVIVPSDFRQGKNVVIRDTLIFSSLLAIIPKGVTVTCLFDACDKGFVLDLPYSWTPKEGQVETAKVWSFIFTVTGNIF